MNTEEKARAYDEAVEKAKDCLKDGTITSTAIDYISTIFPELKDEEVNSNPKEIEYSTMLQSIWGKICELEGKLGDIYAAVSKQKQDNSFWKDVPNPNITPLSVRHCWFPDGTCMNPYRDCVNCPRPYSSGNKSYTSTTTNINPNEVMYDEIPINNQEKKD